MSSQSTRGSADAPAIEIDRLEYSYGTRKALAGISFEVRSGEIFGVLGPNGGGKTTLFRILSTLRPHRHGSVRVLGRELPSEKDEVRRRIGVVFQSPSLDVKLTVAENLRHHGHLHGLRGTELERRITTMLERLGVNGRRGELVETLSGGLQRRVELAKGLLPAPELIILDEPTTGLDPGARRDVWQYIRSLRDTEGTTVLVTTHLLDEAEQCSRLAIIDEGKLISIGTPEALKSAIGGDVITIRCDDAESLAGRIQSQLSLSANVVDEAVRIEQPDGHVAIRNLVEQFGSEISGISLAKPTLEDVFVHETGHRFWSDA